MLLVENLVVVMLGDSQNFTKLNIHSMLYMHERIEKLGLVCGSQTEGNSRAINVGKPQSVLLKSKQVWLGRS